MRKDKLGDLSFVPQAQHRLRACTQHHFERSENIIAACGTNERCCTVGANEVAFGK